MATKLLHNTIVSSAEQGLESIEDAREERFRLLLEVAPDAIVIANHEGRVVLVNSQAEKMFDYSQRELVGQMVEVLMPERFHARHQDNRRNFGVDPRARPMGLGLELFAARKDQSEFPVEISLSPLQTKDGLWVISSIRDITDRKQFEMALRDKNLELERASQAKDRFLASMSHELRTPLNAIIGFTGTLLMELPGRLNEDQKEQLQTIEGSATHLLSLINDLLDLAKIESGKVELRPVAVVCQKVVQDVSMTLRPLAVAKGLRLDTSFPKEDVVVQADPRSLAQILLNLTNNAIKFTEQGSVRIEVQRGHDNGHRATFLRIIDTGIGIRPEDQERLFESFRQVPEEPTRNYRQGTGLGLHLSQMLTHLLGGHIRVQSEFGKGSTFTIVLREE